MTKDEIASVIKKMRLSAGLTQNEAAKKIGRKQQTLASWETAQSQPDANTLFVLCALYGTTVDEAFGFKKDDSFSNEEEVHIKKYRNLDDHGKKMVGLVMQEELQRIQDEHKNREVIGDLAKVIYYDFPASAGTGMFLENEYPTYIEVPKDKIPAGTDFAIRVSGDSMEPNYIDGDIVFVQQAEVRKGDIGIFVIDGDGYIKELGDGILISKNKDYKDIKINENNEQHILGKVVGKL